MTKLTQRITASIAALAIAGFGVACESDTGNGALIGGGVGALAGGIIGHQSGHTAGGALIGGAVGAGTGALIGHASDKNKEAKRDAYEKGYEDGRYRNGGASSASSGGYYSR